jgi:hypothetical protein
MYQSASSLETDDMLKLRKFEDVSVTQEIVLKE